MFCSKTLVALSVIVMGYGIHAQASGSADYRAYILTHTEFRALSTSAQKAYLQDVHKLILAMSQEGSYNIADAFEPSKPEFFHGKWGVIAMLFGREAIAEPGCAAEFTYMGGKICYDNGQGFFCNAEAERMANAECRDKFMSMNRPANSGGIQFPIPKSTATNTPVPKTEQPVNWQTPPPGLPKRLQDIRDNYPYAKKQIEEQNALTDGKRCMDDDGGRKVFRCVYGGFVICTDSLNDACQAKPEAKFGDKTYTCMGGKKNKRGKVINDVLCNPALFGATKETTGGKVKGLCVTRGKNATKQCIQEAKKNKGSLEEAIHIADTEQGKKDWKRNEGYLNDACNGTGSRHTEKFKNAGSATDIVNTCVDLAERRNEVLRGPGTDSGRATQ